MEALLGILDGKAIHFQGMTYDLRLLAEEIVAVAARRGHIPAPDGLKAARMRDPVSGKRVLAMISRLFNEGIIAWGADVENMATTWIHITEYGEKVLRGDINPHDPDGYLTRFKARVKSPSLLVMMYLEESVHCYNYGRLFASSVMLGVSSEAAFEELFEALVGYVTGPEKIKLEKLADDIDTQNKFDKTMEVLKQFKKNFDDDVRNMVERQLAGLYILIRLQRNESGHPTGHPVEREEMHSYLALFPMYCEYIYKLIAWLKANRIV